MAEQPKNGQSQGIGELFVEFGTKGFPTMLKQLNGISASFLLGKNAANQFAQMLAKPIKEAGTGAVAVGKLAAAFGTTLEEAARLKLFFKNYNLSESLIGDLVGISDMLTEVQLGIGGISGKFAYAMHRMGLNWQDYDGSIESMIQMRNDVEKKLKQENFSEPEKRIMRQSVGLNNPEWAYAAQKGDLDLSEYKTISQKQIQNLINTSEATAKLGASFNQLGEYITEKFSPQIIRISDFLSDKAFRGAAGEYKEAGEKLSFKGQSADLVGIGSEIGEKGAERAKNFYNSKIKNGTLTGGAAGILGTLPDLSSNIAPDFMSTPEALAPSNIANLTQNITITNQNNITGDNPSEIASAIASINSQDIEYSQFQLSNLPGI